MAIILRSARGGHHRVLNPFAVICVAPQSPCDGSCASRTDWADKSNTPVIDSRTQWRDRRRLQRTRRQHREANHGGSPYGSGKEGFTIRSAIFAAEHDVPAAQYLRAKTEIAFPIGAEAKQFREMPVLKVGDPGDARETETPAIKLCTLEEHVDAVFAKCLGCGPITAGQ